MSITVQTSFDYNLDFCNFLERNMLDEHRRHITQHNRKVIDESLQFINIMMVDEAGDWVGGMQADYFWEEWVEIDYFWISQPYQTIQWASQLLERLIAFAHQHSAKHILVRTYQKDCVNFYKSQGFQLTGELYDFPPENTFSILVKDL